MGKQDDYYDYVDYYDHIEYDALKSAKETAQRLTDAARLDPDYLPTQITI